MTIALIILFALQWADGYTTWRVIRSGGYERNPVMRRAFDFFGFWPAIAVKSVLVTACGYIAAIYVGLWLLVIFCLAYVAIVYHNWGEAR